MKNYKTVQVMGYEVFSDRLENITMPDKMMIINTLNANSYVVANQDELFKKALQNSDVLVPDGFPVVLAASLIKNVKIRKIAGEDIFYHFCRQMNLISGKCFFLGSSPATLQKLCSRLAQEFPNIKVSSYSPPFKSKFDDDDNRIMLENIRNFSPDVLFVGMTAPKQEKWVDEQKNEIDARIVCSIGAVFDFYAGTTKRPSAFWIKLNLEWLVRLVREPKRLWKRYLVYSPLFFIDMVKYKLRSFYR